MCRTCYSSWTVYGKWNSISDLQMVSEKEPSQLLRKKWSCAACVSLRLKCSTLSGQMTIAPADDFWTPRIMSTFPRIGRNDFVENQRINAQGLALAEFREFSVLGNHFILMTSSVDHGYLEVKTCLRIKELITLISFDSIPWDVALLAPKNNWTSAWNTINGDNKR